MTSLGPKLTVGRVCGASHTRSVGVSSLLSSSHHWLDLLKLLPPPREAERGASTPLYPPALLKNLTALNGAGYGVKALLNVVLDGLEVRHCQNISGIWEIKLPFDLPRAHPCEAARGLHVEALQHLVRQGDQDQRFTHKVWRP